MDMRILLLSPQSPFDKLSPTPRHAWAGSPDYARAPETYHNRRRRQRPSCVAGITTQPDALPDCARYGRTYALQTARSRRTVRGARARARQTADRLYRVEPRWLRRGAVQFAGHDQCVGRCDLQLTRLV